MDHEPLAEQFNPCQPTLMVAAEDILKRRTLVLGRHHLTLSVATVAIVALPLFTLYPTFVLLALLGTAIGSLIPDADSPDAAIFHSEVRGLKGAYGDVLNTVAVLNPAFGQVTKILIYKPAVWFYDRVVFEDRDSRNVTEGSSTRFSDSGRRWS